MLVKVRRHRVQNINKDWDFKFQNLSSKVIMGGEIDRWTQHKGPIDTYMHVVMSKSKLGPSLFLEGACWYCLVTAGNTTLQMRSHVSLSRNKRTSKVMGPILLAISIYLHITSNFYMMLNRMDHRIEFQ